MQTFSVLYANEHSSIRPVNAGVPQSSKISNWLYKAYVHDIAQDTHIILARYADDTTIFEKLKSNRYFHTYLQNMHKLEDYFTKWRTKVNPLKSQEVFFGRKMIPLSFISVENP